MNFDEAIRAHSAWRLKLSVYLRKPDGSLKAEQIQPDNRCALGQWIYGERSRLSQYPEYATLRSEHATFHEAAAEVVRKADSGQSVTEEIAIGGQSKFAHTSNAVVQLIMSIRKRVDSGKTQ